MSKDFDIFGPMVEGLASPDAPAGDLAGLANVQFIPNLDEGDLAGEP